MKLTIRAATHVEKVYAYDQSTQIAEQCGNPGCLFIELDNILSVMFGNWEQNAPSENTPEFKTEFSTVLDMLRFDKRFGYIMKNLSTMRICCLNHPEGQIANRREYVFRADTWNYSYLIRCVPAGEANHIYVYPYRRNMLNLHMKQAEKGIWFVTPDNKEKFRLSDGDMVRIIAKGDARLDRMVRYVSDDHAEIGFNNLWDIREYAEWLESIGSKIIPMRSSLPDKCYSICPTGDEIIIVVKGEFRYYHSDYCHDRETARVVVEKCNGKIGVTKAQESAMLAGVLFGWDTPAADPKNYDEKGAPLKPAI